MDPLDKQNVEFEALNVLAAQWNVLRNIPVVDDDYPVHRGYYEAALMKFIEALRTNGRI